MKQNQARTLRDSWGDQPCPHPAFSREYDQAGERTGNYFCTQFGTSISFREAELLAEGRGTESEPREAGES